MLHPGDVLEGYRLESYLGEGAFGEVWLAKRREGVIERAYALKLLKPDPKQHGRYLAEATLWEAVTRVKQAHILHLHHAGPYRLPGATADSFLLVSDYCPEGTLQDWLDRQGGRAPSWERAVEITLGILHGLAVLHAQTPPILHRDLKPANILMQGDVPLLADFGIASAQSDSVHLTGTHGTLAWMPPEALEEEDEVAVPVVPESPPEHRVSSVQWDIWSVGVILQHLLSGGLPFPHKGYHALKEAILSKEPVRMYETVPEPLCAVVAKALKKDRKERWRMAHEMADALEQARNEIHEEQKQAELRAVAAKGERATEAAKKEAVVERERAEKAERARHAAEEAAHKEAERLRKLSRRPANLPAIAAIVAFGAIGSPIVFINYQSYQIEQRAEAAKKEKAEHQAEQKRKTETDGEKNHDKVNYKNSNIAGIKMGVCALSHLKANKYCPDVAEKIFSVDTKMPVCTLHKPVITDNNGIKIYICTGSGRRATVNCPEKVAQRFSVGTEIGTCRLHKSESNPSPTPSPKDEIEIEICAETSRRAMDYCPEKVTRRFPAGTRVSACMVHKSESNPSPTPSPTPTPSPKDEIEINVCAETSKRATDYCPEKVTRRFPAGTRVRWCTVHRATPGEEDR